MGGSSAGTHHKETPDSPNLFEYQKKMMFVGEEVNASPGSGGEGYNILNALNCSVLETFLKTQKDLVVNF